MKKMSLKRLDMYVDWMYFDTIELISRVDHHYVVASGISRWAAYNGNRSILMYFGGSITNEQRHKHGIPPRRQAPHHA